MMKHNMSSRQAIVWSSGGWTRKQLGNTRRNWSTKILANPWCCLVFVLPLQSCEVVPFHVFQSHQKFRPPTERCECWGWSNKTRLSVQVALLTLPRNWPECGFFFFLKNWCCKQFQSVLIRSILFRCFQMFLDMSQYVLSIQTYLDVFR